MVRVTRNYRRAFYQCETRADAILSGRTKSFLSWAGYMDYLAACDEYDMSVWTMAGMNMRQRRWVSMMKRRR